MQTAQSQIISVPGVSSSAGGTVINAGALTLNHLILGDGGSEIKADTGATSDGAGNIHAVTFVATGDITAAGLVATAATPTTTSGQIGFGTTNGVGNSAPAPVLAPAQGTGSGPALPSAIVNWLEMDIAGTKYWIPLAQ